MLLFLSLFRPAINRLFRSFGNQPNTGHRLQRWGYDHQRNNKFTLRGDTLHFSAASFNVI